MEFKDFSRTSPKIQGLFRTVRTLFKHDSWPLSLEAKGNSSKQFTSLSCSISYANSVKFAYTQQLDVIYQVTALLHKCTCTLKFILTQSFRVTQIRQRKSFFARHASTVEYGRSCRQLVVLSATGHNWGHLGLVVWNVIYVLDRFLFSIYRMNLIV